MLTDIYLSMKVRCQMSISSALVAAQGRVAIAYTAISAKGGTLPQTQNLANMPAAINSIPSGGGGNIPNYQIVNGVLSRKTSTYNLTGSEFSSVTSINDYGLYFAFYNCTGITGSVNLSSVTSIGMYGLYSAFYNCAGLVGSVDLSSVTSIGNSGMQNAFSECTGLTNVNLSSVTSIGKSGMQNAFYYCTGLTGSVDLSSVTSIGNSGMQNAFRNTGITDLYFNSLTSSSFGSYTNQFSYMLNNVTGCTVHFPSNLQSVIGSWADVTNGFGGRNTTVLFDLESTE